jgi:RimJ/RimL family protein N-acetyltransferase
MADFAFTRLGAEALYAVCDPQNGASIAVTMKLGMRYHGLEDWYSRKLAVYELTAENWRSSKITQGDT